MLNLSDNELDRLSREAADRHDPGDLTGPQSWDRLELRLDKELGRIGPNPLQGIRRIPFYYAPVIILLVGVSYYFIKGKSNSAKTAPPGSPPMTVIKPSSPAVETTDPSPKIAENSRNSTPPATTETVTRSAASARSEATTGPDHDTRKTESPDNSPASITPGEAAAASNAPGSTMAPNTSGSTAHPNTAASPGHKALPPAPTVVPGSAIAPGSTSSYGNTHNNTTRSRSHGKPLGQSSTPTSSDDEASGLSANTRGISGKKPGTPVNSDQSTADKTTGSINNTPPPTPMREPALSTIQVARSLALYRGVDDSALRAFNAKDAATSGPIRLDKKQDASLHINRPLQFGFSLSPDFASVHSLSGDKPGSSIGLTMDYQITNRLYLSTGLLLTRKNYASSPQDYHVPKDYYQINNIHDVNLIKGSFSMLEIPLNLRYDFNLTGNTVFFVSGGASSYLFTSENSQYYYNFFGRQACRDFNKEAEVGTKNYLFAAVNLSMGVETGISNSLSLLIAPYVKLPTANMGFGQIQITSVGLNFALKYAPVLSRKRR